MKIKRVAYNNRKKAFEVSTRRGTYNYPYSKLEIGPSRTDRVSEAFVDRELGGEGFSYRLQSGREGTVHVEQVLDYNQDPEYLGDLLLYRLTLEAQKRVHSSAVGIRALARRLSTSPAQLYRLLDQTNTRKSIRQMLALLYVLDCEVDLVIRERRAA